MASKSQSSISSQSSIDKVREELNCSICFEQFREPKMLPCFHTFCRECLENTKRSFQGKLSCPTCRSITEVQDVSEVDKLPNNFIVNRVLEALTAENGVPAAVICTNCEDNNEAEWNCLDCGNFLCVTCYDAHNRMSHFRKTHKVKNIDAGKSDLNIPLEAAVICSREKKCTTHKEKELDLYCTDCSMCICTVCFGTSHQGHNLKNANHAIEEQKSEIQKLLAVCDQNAAQIEDTREEIGVQSENISQRHDRFRDEIMEAVSLVTLVVNEKANSMLDKLDNICKQRKKTLDAQKEELSLKALKLESVQNFAKEVLQAAYLEEVVSCKGQLLQRLSELNKDEEFPVLASDFFHVSFDVSKAIECIKTGFVSESDTIPGKTEFKIINIPVQGEDVIGQVIAHDLDGRMSWSPCDDVEVFISSPSGKKTKEELVNNVNSLGEYSISFVPEESGSHTICVTINGQKAWKNPRSFYVSRNFMNVHHVQSGFGSRGDGEAEFCGPTGVAVNNKGTVATADSGNHRIQLFDSDGKYKHMFGRQGKKLKEMQHPRSVAFHHDGSLVVLDTGNSKVLMFSVGGEFLWGFGKFGCECGEFSCPLGLSVSKSGKMIVTDTGNNRVQVFNSGGIFQLEFGAEGPGKLRHPESTVFSNENYIVADTGNNCLKFFSPEGQHLHTIKSVNDHAFAEPCHISCDPNGFFVVCDRESHRLKVYGPDMSLVTYLSRQGEKPGQLLYPHASCITSKGVIVVADWGNHRVQCFF